MAKWKELTLTRMSYNKQKELEELEALVQDTFCSKKMAGDKVSIGYNNTNKLMFGV